MSGCAWRKRRGQARFLWFDKQPVPNTGLGNAGQSPVETVVERGRQG